MIRIDRARPLLGTIVSIGVSHEDDAAANHAIDQGFARIARIHELMSFHESGSDVTRLNRDAHRCTVHVSPETYDVISVALEVSAESAGVFDVTTARELVLWGFLPNPGDAGIGSAAATWRDIELLDDHRVRFHRPLWIDLGGIAKGCAVDYAIEAMNLPAAYQCRVNAGGDLRIAGPASERVFLQAQPPTFGSLPILTLQNGSVASSCADITRRIHGKTPVGPHVDGTRRTAAGLGCFASVLHSRCGVADALTKVVLSRPTECAAVLDRFAATALVMNPMGVWTQHGSPAQAYLQSAYTR